MASKNGAREYAESTFTGLNIDPRIIEVEKGFNARNFDIEENKEHVRALAESIKAVGVQTPLVVRFVGDKFVLVDGESRLRAVKLAISEGADIKSVPAVQEGKGVSEADRVASLVSRNAGKQLNLMERGEVFSRLIKFGWKEDEIARKTGVTTTTVANVMVLHTAPEKVKKLVRDGNVAPSMAIQAIRDHGDKAATVLEDAVVVANENGKSKATAKHVTAKTSKEKQKRAPFSFTATEGKAFFSALVDLHSRLSGAENRKYRQIAIDAFENQFGEGWKEYVETFKEEYGL